MRITIPPAIQGPLFGLLSWYAANRYPQFAIDWGALHYLAAIFMLAGLTIVAIAISHFLAAKTTINPMTPDNAGRLVKTGLYKISRNPMYLGVLLLLLGWAAYLQNILSFAPPLLFVVSMTLLQIKPEEKALRAKFGTEYEAYCHRVRRWI